MRQAHQELQAFKEIRALQVQLAQPARKEFRDQLALKALLVHKVKLALQAQLAHEGQLAFKEQQAPLVPLGQRELLA